MKKLILLCICFVALPITLPGQTPTASPIVSSSTTATPAATTITTAATATPTPTTSASPFDLAEKIHQKLEKKLRGKHGIIIDGGDKEEDADLQKMRDFVAIPIVAIVFLSIFGAPVLIVIMIGIFALIGSRMRQRTIRMMVEKGQPVPEALLNPPPVVRQRSDLRRGIILLSIGAGLMVLLGALNEWEGGAWSLGFIPFIIGLGYLLVWRLDVHKEEPSPKV